MSNSTPRVSIGLPVYNGEQFLKEALDSILAQTFEDFEVIISDNASTDSTKEICQAYVAKDSRIRYFRNETNIGAAKNFNRTFELSSGEYFKWAAHDDAYVPTFLEKCVSVLDQSPSVVLCYTEEMDIDEQGRYIGKRPYGLDTSLVKPYDLFCNMTSVNRGSPAVFGVIRASVLKKTALIGGYYASDLVLLAELTLYGSFRSVPEDLMLHREHNLRSVYTHSYSARHSAAAWWNPERKKRIAFPIWRMFLGYLASIIRSPLSWAERMRCCLYMMKWMRWRWRDAIEDLTVFAKQLFAPLRAIR